MTNPWGRGIVAGMLAVALAFGAMLPAACERSSGVSTAVTSGVGGGEAGCYNGPPVPLFVVTISAFEGTLPADTSVLVKWSTGEEPIFLLDDPSSWKTREDGSNLVCDVELDAGAPTELESLRCELWTSGATELVVSGGQLPQHEQTLVPLDVPGCDEPVASDVEVVLGDMPDGGM